MKNKILVRITTKPLALEKLLEGQLSYINNYLKVFAISSDKNRLEKFGKKNNIEVIHLEMTRKITPIKDLIALVKLIKIFIRIRPNIVHSHTPKAGIIAMLAAYILNIKSRIHTVAGLPLHEAKGVKRIILENVERLTYFFATKVYTNSFKLMNFIINQNYITKNKISVLCNGSTNGINTDYFKRESIDEIFIKTLKNKYKINDKNFIYIFIGRIVGDKGVNEIINAFKIISKKNQIVKLLIVGEYENKLDPLEPRSITEIESNKNIIFCGWQDDVRPYLLISDVLLLPSYREGFPNVVLQAGAMEIPSIVTNINGCNEIIKNNFNGLIVEKKNHIDLKNKMLKILNDKKLYRYLKENCRKNITKNYEQKLIWHSLLIEYKKILY